MLGIPIPAHHGTQSIQSVLRAVWILRLGDAIGVQCHAIALFEPKPSQLVAVIERLAPCLAKCRVHRRRKAPAAFQLLELHDEQSRPLNNPKIPSPTALIQPD